MNIYLNGYLTSVELEQKANFIPIYLLDQGQVIPYPSPECTSELIQNSALETKLRSLIQAKFTRGQEFGRMLSYISDLRKYQKKSEKGTRFRKDSISAENGKVVQTGEIALSVYAADRDTGYGSGQPGELSSPEFSPRRQNESPNNIEKTPPKKKTGDACCLLI